MQCSNKPDGCRDCVDTSSACTHVQSIGNDTHMAENEAESIRTCRIWLRMQDSPEMHEASMPEPTRRWRKVSVDDGDVYVPQNMPIDRTGQIFIFG